MQLKWYADIYLQKNSQTSLVPKKSNEYLPGGVEVAYRVLHLMNWLQDCETGKPNSGNQIRPVGW